MVHVVFTFAELLMGAERSTKKADDCTLVTNNMREFERVAGLRLENWAESAGLPPVG